jgi:hypothetical protein
MPDSGYINIITANHRSGFYRFQNSKDAGAPFFREPWTSKFFLGAQTFSPQRRTCGPPWRFQDQNRQIATWKGREIQIGENMFRKSTIHQTLQDNGTSLLKLDFHSVLLSLSVVIPALLEAIVGDAQDNQQANSRENDDRCVSTWLQGNHRLDLSCWRNSWPFRCTDAQSMGQHAGALKKSRDIWDVSK